MFGESLLHRRYDVSPLAMPIHVRRFFDDRPMRDEPEIATFGLHLAGAQLAPKHIAVLGEAEMLTLKQQLREAVAEERYEEAARLRDLIRTEEAADESR